MKKIQANKKKQKEADELERKKERIARGEEDEEATENRPPPSKNMLSNEDDLPVLFSWRRQFFNLVSSFLIVIICKVERNEWFGEARILKILFIENWEEFLLETLRFWTLLCIAKLK